jgi:heme o synthase
LGKIELDRIIKHAGIIMIKPLRKLPLSLIILTKPIITLSVAFSAFTAYIMHEGGFTDGWLSMYLGVLLTAAGSSTLNQIQESEPDQLMERTKNRPLPAKEISIQTAAIWAIILVASGACLLWIFANPFASVLAIITIVWYNGIYTPLKRFSPWAILPGAIVGAIPPVIGWVAAGGSIMNHHILYLAFFFFIGQVPHFWLILLRHSDDYEKGGFPSINTTFTKPQISRLTFSWTLATAITAIGLPIYGLISSQSLSVITVISSVLLIILFFKLIKNEQFANQAFIIMNIYFLCIMLIIISDSLLRGKALIY